MAIAVAANMKDDKTMSYCHLKSLCNSVDGKGSFLGGVEENRGIEPQTITNLDNEKTCELAAGCCIAGPEANQGPKEFKDRDKRPAAPDLLGTFN